MNLIEIKIIFYYFYINKIKIILNKIKVMFKFPSICPSCEETLKVSQLKCNYCETSIHGNYPLPVFLQLTQKEQEFILQFFLTSGSLKEMASQLGISYPTVRNQLDDMIEHVKQLQNQNNNEK